MILFNKNEFLLLTSPQKVMNLKSLLSERLNVSLMSSTLLHVNAAITPIYQT